MGIKTPSLANIRPFEAPVPTASTQPTLTTTQDCQISPNNCNPYSEHVATSILSNITSSGLRSVANSAALSPAPSFPWPPLCICKYYL